MAVWLDAVLQDEELPTCKSDLDTSLADVDAGCFTHWAELRELFDAGLADDRAKLLLFDVGLADASAASAFPIGVFSVD